MRDIALMRRVLEAISAAPQACSVYAGIGGKSWRQADWRSPIYGDTSMPCGTSMCFAGWTADLAGAQWVYSYEDLVTLHCDGPNLVSIGEVLLEGGDHQHVAEWAQERLGLTGDEAERLFSGSNGFDELSSIVDEFERLETEDAVQQDI